MSENLLLKSLPRGEGRRLADSLDEVELQLEQVLIEPDRPFDYVYFPRTCMVSIVTLLETGERIEAATVGREGVVGLPIFLGLKTVSTEAIVQMPGRALRMPSDDFREAIDAVAGMRAALGLYTQTLVAMLGQNGACISSHSIEQRLARWLLTVSDRVDSDSFNVTHDFLAQMLGAQRPSVTIAAGLLQNAGLIKYRHGHVHIEDKDALEQTACECYDLIRRLYESTFHKISVY